MKIVTWNVNSIRVRMPRVLEFLDRVQPDVVCLQETKVIDELFPREEIEAAGYQVAFHGQKTYNGVALLSRHPLEDVVIGIPGYDDPQRRVIAATVIGGANLMGGAGTAFGAVIGAAFLEVIRNALLMAGIDSNWQGAFVGAFIILAVLLGMQSGGKSLIAATVERLFPKKHR